MSYDNSEVRIEGYIGHDCTELKKDKNGKEFCRFSVGVVTGKGNCTWYQVMAYDDMGAQLIKKNRIKKGLECYVRGRLKVTSYIKGNSSRINIGIFADRVFIQEKLLSKEHEADLKEAEEMYQEFSSTDEAPF